MTSLGFSFTWVLLTSLFYCVFFLVELDRVIGMGPIRMVAVIYFQFYDFKIKLLYDIM